MRFIHGDSLKEAIDSYQIATPAQATRASGRSSCEALGQFVDVCDAIEYAHSRGIIHRDLKPGNIMLGNFGETLVVDWGLAKKSINPTWQRGNRTDQLQSASQSSVHSRSANQADAAERNRRDTNGLGRRHAADMSPEQAAGRSDLIGPRSDVYSLGATLISRL